MTWNDIPRNPSRTTLWQFGGLCLVVFGVMAYLKFSAGSPVMGTIFAALSAMGAVGLVWPELLGPVFVGWLMLVFPIGWVVSRLLLSSIYFGLFVPMGWLSRLRGRDPLRLNRPGPESLWVPRGPRPEAVSYYRQF
jgi:hypothetical protein